MSGFITQSINGVEAEADSDPNLLARIWVKIREWADKIHTHDNKKTLDKLYCKALEDVFSQGDDGGYLTFRGDKLRPVSDGVVIQEVKEIEKDSAKFLRLLLNLGGGLSNNLLPDFIDIPVNAVKDVEEENPDFTLNGSEIELPTGGADPNDFVTRNEWDENNSVLDERIIFNTTLGEMAVKKLWTDIEFTVVSLEPTFYYNFGEVESLTLDFAEIHDTFSIYRHEYSFTFISGATPTVLTLPASVQWANELTIEANKRYEISIVDNIGLWCAVDLAVTE